MACQEKKKCTVHREESKRLLTEVATNSFILVSVQCMKIAHCPAIRNLKSGNLYLWNPESWALESETQFNESGIPLKMESEIQDSLVGNPESSSWSPEGMESRIQDCL